MASDNLRNGAGFKVWITWVFALWGVDQEEVFAYFQAAFFNTWKQFFFSCAWVSGTFQRQ